jgi:hypothetical protein
MIGLKFEHDRLKHFVDRLLAGEEIDPRGQAWDRNELLSLAGACLFGAMMQGAGVNGTGVNGTGAGGEQSPLSAAKLRIELLMAIEFLSTVAMTVHGGGYENDFEPEVNATVECNGSDKTVIQIVSGCKHTSGSVPL